jgi:ABC-type Fe3+/spermidine/putrescine transport system ATPase subunit
MLRLDALTKRFGATTAVEELSLEVTAGEFLTLLGPSGCGKTTTLRLIAGFEQPTRGRVVLAGRDVTKLPPQRRGFGMVFQNYALFPHLDVGENIAFGLRTRRVPRAEVAARVEKALERVDLPGMARRPVQELSGGQQQRVALARALAPEPAVLLLDEPFSNLDAALRERTRTELRSLLKRLKVTAVFVTHDQDEAFALSDRVALLKDGRLQQVGTPETLYREPATAFVASFLGRANFFPARVVATHADGTADCELPDRSHLRARLVGGAERMDRVQLMVRPESLRIAQRRSGDTAETTGIPGVITEQRFLGAVTHYSVRTLAGDLLVVDAAGRGDPGGKVILVPAKNALLAFPDLPT